MEEGERERGRLKGRRWKVKGRRREESSPSNGEQPRLNLVPSDATSSSKEKKENREWPKSIFFFFLFFLFFFLRQSLREICIVKSIIRFLYEKIL